MSDDLYRRPAAESLPPRARPGGPSATTDPAAPHGAPAAVPDPYARTKTAASPSAAPHQSGPPTRVGPAAGPHDLVARGLVVRYGAVTALAGVDLVARPGEVLVVAGPSGAGKTTLLWALSGAVRPDEGAVTLAGELLGAAAGVVSPDVALVPQGNGLAAVLTASENVGFPLLAAGLAPHEATERVGSALAALGLTDQAGHLVDELSGGQQQRVAVARALAWQPRVLLADEPTSELDHTSRERVLDLLRAQARLGAVVVMATHDPDALAWADRELHLDEGRVVAGGAVA